MATKTAVAPVPRSRAASVGQSCGVCALRRHQPRAAERDPPPLDLADDALADQRAKPGGVRERRARARPRRGRWLRRSGARWRAPGWRPAAATRAPSTPGLALTVVTDGRPCGQRAGLVESDEGRRAPGAERLGVAHQHAGRRAAADAHHHRHRRRQAQRARTGDDQHRDRRAERVGEPRLRAEHHPRDEAVTSAITITAGANQPETWSASRWIGARLRCASATIWTIRATSVSAPTFSARIDKAAAHVDRAADDLVARPLLDRHRLAGEQRLVDLTLAARHLAVDRDRLAGPHAQRIADADVAQRDRLVGPVGDDAPRRLRGQRQEAADRPAGARARPQLQHLAEQRQHHDDRGGLEVERRDPPRRARRPGRDRAQRARRGWRHRRPRRPARSA